MIGVIGPGLLIAATGVGAGDLATGAFTGSKLGLAVLWAVLLGAFIKFVLTEGLTRYQLATGQTLLEGIILRLGAVAKWGFLVYLLVWTFGVGASLMSACGVAGHALAPVFDDPETGKVVWAIVHSLAGMTLVLIGSFRVFERLISIMVGLMFIAVVITAVQLRPDLTGFLHGLFVPSIPEYTDANGRDQGLAWTLALMGGVGGTLTIVCYGYWIREENRQGIESLKLCRLDLMTAYLVTAAFGVAMVVIAAGSDLDGRPSAMLIVSLADRLGQTTGQVGQIVFLVGAWAAVFTSLLGVWQSAPYLFADFWSVHRQSKNDPAAPSPAAAIDRRGWRYRGFLLFITFAPMLALGHDFEVVQMLYAIFGALVMPLLALVLLLLNGRAKWVGRAHRNRWWTVLVLLATIGFFLYLGGPKLADASIRLLELIGLIQPTS